MLGRRNLGWGDVTWGDNAMGRHNLTPLQSIRAWCKPFSTTKQNCTKRELMIPKVFYNKASRAAQSNSVYVRVLKIPIVHADSVSKSFRQNFCFFARAVNLLARGKVFYFATVMDTNRDSAHQSQNEDNFATFSPGLEFLNEAEKEKNNGKGDSASAPSRFASLSVFRVGFDAQFHRLCCKTIGSCF